MIAFPEMLVPAAVQAKMKVPDNPRSFDTSEYPHFQVFCNVQLGFGMPSPTAHWDNAQVIAAIPDSEIMSVTRAQLLDLGLQVSA